MYDPDRVPQHIKDVLQRYFVDRVAPGHFLTAVLNGDLIDACNKADGQNGEILYHIGCYIILTAPPGSFGSKKNVNGHLKRRR